MGSSNRFNYNDEEHAEHLAIRRKRPVENKTIGFRIEPPTVDFAKIAQGFQIHAEGPIEDPKELRGALERALKVVRDKREPALMVSLNKGVRFIHSIQLFLFGIFFLFPREALGQTSPGNLVGEAKKEGKVTFYTTINVSESKPLLEAFKSRYPFLEPELNRLGGTALLNKIINEARGGKYSADVIEGRAEFIVPLKKAGLIAKYDSPERRYYPENLKDREGYWTAFFVNVNTPGYNTRMVSSSEVPRSYEEMLHPRWKGKLSMDTESYEWFRTVLKLKGKEQGAKFFHALKEQNPIFRRGHTLQVQLMAAGEFPLVVNLYANRIETFKKEGAPVEWYPIEPVPTLIFVVLVSSKAPHPASARLLVDYLLSKDGQEFARGTHRVPAREDVEPDPPRLKKGLKWFVANPEEGEDYSEIVSLYRRTFGLR